MKKRSVLLKLFFSTLYLSAFTFGGGYVIITLMKKQFVDKYHWIEESEMLDLIIKEGKQRQDSIEQYKAANREDLAGKEAAELAVLQGYLPKPLSDEELTAVIDAAIAATGASSPRDMGKVISAVMADHKGRVDGKALSAAVKARLSN